MTESAIFPYPGHWELTTLGQLCIDGGGGVQTGPFGSQLHSADYVEVGIPSIMPKNISIEGVSTEDIARITEEDALRLSKYLVKEGDIVYSRRGDVEKCSLITQHEHGWLCGTGCLKVSLGENSKVPSSYIHAYLSHPAIREWISRHAIGATMPNLNTSILSAVPVLIPPTDEIDIIVGIWRNTTDKVVLNHQTNQTLEQIAQAIFKSWFVDFEPTRAKIIAKEQGANLATQELAAQAIICGAITLEQLAEVEQNLETTLQQAIDKKLNQHNQTNPTALNAQQLKTTAALFPNELVESELGDVPEGWAISSVGEHVKVTKGRSYKSVELEESDTALVTLKSFMRGGGYREDGLKAYTGAYKPEQVVEPGELVMSLTDVTQAAEIIGKPAIVTKNNDFKTLVASLDVSILRPKKKEMKEYFYGLMSTYRFHRYAESFATGTTVLHLNTKGITSFEFALPDFELCRVFSKMVLPMLAVQQSNIHLSRTLEELRDSLLPKLLSGELDVSAFADNSQADA